MVGWLGARERLALRPWHVSDLGNKKALFPGPICEAGERARTVDPQLGKLMLYQLSYARVGAAILARAA